MPEFKAYSIGTKAKGTFIPIDNRYVDQGPGCIFEHRYSFRKPISDILSTIGVDSVVEAVEKIKKSIEDNISGIKVSYIKLDPDNEEMVYQTNRPAGVEIVISEAVRPFFLGGLLLLIAGIIAGLVLASMVLRAIGFVAPAAGMAVIAGSLLGAIVLPGFYKIITVVPFTFGVYTTFKGLHLI